MATTQHSALTGSDLHEPKGADAAAQDTTYFSDGAASGSWKKVYTQGFWDYNDATTSSTPINLTSAGVDYDMTNDGAGANTNTTYALPDVSDVWDTSNNEFDFSGLSVGDTVDIRFDVEITTAGANHQVEMKLDMAHGHANEYELQVHRETFKTANTYKVVVMYSVYMGDSVTQGNPAKLVVNSDATGDSVKVNGWYVRVVPRNPILST